ncbi:MAG: WD40/YVTN/BNR-like repeat-containing protein [Bryobacteraceae bacterium]
MRLRSMSFPGSRSVLWTAAVGLCAVLPYGSAQEAKPAENPAISAPEASLTLENNGRPMALAFRCTAEDIRWAGLSCSEDDPCPIFLELSSAEPVGTRLIVTGNIHAEAETLYSVLLATDDAGKTWNEAFERLRGAGLDRIDALDASTAWVSGQELFPIPQNPFLLASSDGGKSWERKPVLNEAVENRFGSVQQFHFANKNDGSLIVDRGPGNGGDAAFALYETRDGGESWQPKQESNKPLTLGQPAPAGEWRIRVESAPRAYQIERRQGEKWVRLAAFSVNLEPCKPPSVENDGGR